MSFILDALKKLEREKDSRKGGVVMVGPVRWGGPDRSAPRRGRALGLAALMVLAAIAIWWLAAPAKEPSPAPRASSEAAPTATPPPGEALPPRGPRAPETARAAAAVPETTPPPPRALALPGDATESAPALRARVTEDPEETPRALETEGQPGDLSEATDSDAPPAPEAPPPTPAPRFRLTVISERDGEPIALLNDRLVREGDRFEDITVIRIGTSEVEIEVDGERRTIGF